jgi:hypothetical protein
VGSLPLGKGTTLYAVIVLSSLCWLISYDRAVVVGQIQRIREQGTVSYPHELWDDLNPQFLKISLNFLNLNGKISTGLLDLIVKINA